MLGTAVTSTVGGVYVREAEEGPEGDAIAIASYRKLAEDAVATMTEIRAEMTKLAEHVSAVEQLMRDVG